MNLAEWKCTLDGHDLTKVWAYGPNGWYCAKKTWDSGYADALDQVGVKTLRYIDKPDTLLCPNCEGKGQLLYHKADPDDNFDEDEWMQCMMCQSSGWVPDRDGEGDRSIGEPGDDE